MFQNHFNISGLFLELGATTVTTIAVAEDLSLLESWTEFKTVIEGTSDGMPQTPIFTAICPGWIHDVEINNILEKKHISRIKSSQQIMGGVVKFHWAQKLNGISAANVFHAVLMSCQEKKIEASKDDQIFIKYGSKAVDFVVTPAEIEGILKNLGIMHLEDCTKGNLTNLFGEKTKELEVFRTMGNQSGGYAKFVAWEFAKTRGVKQFPEWVSKDNSGFLEMVLDGKRFCVVTGRKSIDILMEKIKENTFIGHYVEIWTCNSGSYFWLKSLVTSINRKF